MAGDPEGPIVADSRPVTVAAGTETVGQRSGEYNMLGDRLRAHGHCETTSLVLGILFRDTLGLALGLILNTLNH